MTIEQVSQDLAKLSATSAQLAAVVKKQQEQIDFLLVQTRNLYQRLNLQPVPMTLQGQQELRTETGMGAIISPDKSSFV